MNDWKDALSALAGYTPEKKEESKKEKGVSLKKNKGGMVYSTNPNFAYTDDETIIQTLPKNQQKLRLSMERAGRGGKTVTLVRGFIGADSDLKNLCKLLKQKCGVGGTTKEGEIIIQGDHRPKLMEILKKEGYTQTK